ncbi:MAG: hypothetical protein ACI4R8_02740 [Candidatus Caccovivens sp.]
MEDRLQCTRIIKRDYTQYFNCENRDLEDNFDGDREISVFYFPGNGGITSKDANGGCKIVENGLLLGFSDKEELYKRISIYGIYYGFDYTSQNTGEMSKNEVKTFVKNYLLSRCLDENKNILTLDEICKKMSKVTFVGFCHGQTEICKVIKELRFQLEEKGLTHDDTYKVATHLFSVCYSPEIIRVECPTVQAYSISDLKQRNEGLVRDLFDSYMKDLKIKPDGILVDFEKRGILFGESLDGATKSKCDFERVKIFSTKLLNEHTTNENEHLFQLLSRDNKWDISYANDKNLDCFSQMFFYSIANGVDRGMKTEDKRIKPVDMVGLYKMVCKIERDFKSKDLQEHIK